jgi:hypothetical protein
MLFIGEVPPADLVSQLDLTGFFLTIFINPRAA